MDKINDEYLKLMYDRIYDELNRGRDWPIKIMAFASAAYLALFGLIKLDTSAAGFSCPIKALFTLLLGILWFLTIKIIIRQHLNYLKYRDIQIKIQKAMGVYDWKVDDEAIFPASWKKSINISIWTGFFGWAFYAFYITVIAIITLCLIWSF
jgi:hypothetical protein